MSKLLQNARFLGYDEEANRDQTLRKLTEDEKVKLLDYIFSHPNPDSLADAISEFAEETYGPDAYAVVWD